MGESVQSCLSPISGAGATSFQNSTGRCSKPTTVGFPKRIGIEISQPQRQLFSDHYLASRQIEEGLCCSQVKRPSREEFAYQAEGTCFKGFLTMSRANLDLLTLISSEHYFADAINEI